MKMNKLSPIILNGLSVSKGIAIGKCKIIEHGQRNIEKSILKKNEDIKKELLKFDNAHKSTLDELKKIKNKIKPSVQKNIIHDNRKYTLIFVSCVSIKYTQT